MPARATIVGWFPMRGYGFARCDQGAGRDVFVHIRDANVKFLHVGDRIECEVETHERGPVGRQVKLVSYA
jgi:cold shock CspA family protein